MKHLPPARTDRPDPVAWLAARRNSEAELEAAKPRFTWRMQNTAVLLFCWFVPLFESSWRWSWSSHEGQAESPFQQGLVAARTAIEAKLATDV